MCRSYCSIDGSSEDRMQIDAVESIPISHRSSKGYLVEQEISWTAWMTVGVTMTVEATVTVETTFLRE